MAAHSSVLAWKTPWTEEPGGLKSRGHKELDTNWFTEDTSMRESDVCETAVCVCEGMCVWSAECELSVSLSV